jgi:Flp pilus assembly pilin Flp
MRVYSAGAMNVARREAAATSLEYALIAAAIAVVIASSVRVLGTTLQGVFNQVAAGL